MVDDLVMYCYRFGHAEFDQASMTLSVDGVIVKLEQRPMQVLAVLLEQANLVVTRDQLLDRVWGETCTEDGSVSTAITKLRRALCDTDASLIVTVPRVGYRLQAMVEKSVIGQRRAGLGGLVAGSPVPGRENFRLERSLGQPASHVWLARHPRTHEVRVYKFAGDEERLSSLRREASLYRVLLQTLGERKEYARLLDWNFESPPYFLECEYGGANLLEWALEEGQLQRLNQQARLALFLQIADSVALAHSVGVLHKDLKPGNVLVERNPDGWCTRLTDFGSGRMLSPGRLQELGITQLEKTQGISASGTPLYMAPEVVAGQVPNVQSDVYSLGVILYQMMVGDLRRPIVPGWERDVGDDLLREDIAAATDGDSRRRLVGVAELTQRLRTIAQRHEERVRDEDVARRAALAEHELQKALARRPWLAGLVVSLCVGLVLSLILYRKAVVAADEARRQARRADAINRFLNDDLLKSADPSGPGGISDPGLHDVLGRASHRLEQQFADDVVTKAAISLSLGDAYFGLSDFVRAADLQGKASFLFKEGLGASDPKTLGAQYQLVRTLNTLGRYAEAATNLDQADQGLSKLSNQEPQLLMMSAWLRGGLALRQMKVVEALRHYEALEALRQKLIPEDEFWMVRARQDLAWCYVRLNRAGDAELSLRPLINERYTPARIGALEWAKAHFTYTTALTRLSRYEQSEELLKAAVHELQGVLGPNHYIVGLGLEYLSAAHQAQDDWLTALKVQNDCVVVYQTAVGKDAGATIVARGTLGLIQLRLGDWKAALDTLPSSIESVTKVLGKDSPFVDSFGFHYAEALRAAGRFAQAQQIASTVDPAKLAIAEPGIDGAAKLKELIAAIGADLAKGIRSDE